MALTEGPRLSVLAQGLDSPSARDRGSVAVSAACQKRSRLAPIRHKPWDPSSSRKAQCRRDPHRRDVRPPHGELRTAASPYGQPDCSSAATAFRFDPSQLLFRMRQCQFPQPQLTCRCSRS